MPKKKPISNWFVEMFPNSGIAVVLIIGKQPGCISNVHPITLKKNAR